MKTRRQAAILELITENSIETQEELLSRLKEKGFNVTQATVSRDIKELRLLKTLSNDGKYHYTSYSKKDDKIADSFINRAVVSIKQAQNMVVIKTLSGMANAICASIDSVDFKGVLGTIAGDDTIFIVCSDNERADDFVFEIKKYL